MIGNIGFSNNRFHKETKEGQKLTNLLLAIENLEHERHQHPKSCRDEVTDSSQENRTNIKAYWFTIYYQDILPLKHVSSQVQSKSFLTRPSMEPSIHVRMHESLGNFLKPPAFSSIKQMLIEQPERKSQSASRYYCRCSEWKPSYVYDIISTLKHIHQQEVENTLRLPMKKSNMCNMMCESLIFFSILFIIFQSIK